MGELRRYLANEVYRSKWCRLATGEWERLPLLPSGKVNRGGASCLSDCSAGK